jgi:hypothetical protein
MPLRELISLCLPLLCSLKLIDSGGVNGKLELHRRRRYPSFFGDGLEVLLQPWDWGVSNFWQCCAIHSLVVKVISDRQGMVMT